MSDKRLDDKSQDARSNNVQPTNPTNNTATNKKNKLQTDPNKMQDVLLSAGVDIKQEEAILNSTVYNKQQQSLYQMNNNNNGYNYNSNNNLINNNMNNIIIPPHPPFLHPDQVLDFMKKVTKEQFFQINNSLNNITNNNNSNTNTTSRKELDDVIQLISSSCEHYIRDIITQTIIISRHRRSGVNWNNGQRSEIQTNLRLIALQMKKDEDKRLKKRITLGLEKENLDSNIDSQETLHRASNVTATLRAGTKKQYGWLKAASINKPINNTNKSLGKIANEIVARGEIGLKFKDAREEPGIVMRDLLFALENRHFQGVQTILSKGYSRIRD